MVANGQWNKCVDPEKAGKYLGNPPLQKEQKYYWGIQVVLTEYHELKKRVSFELSHERKKYVMTYSFSHGKKSNEKQVGQKKKN